ncbi:MAG: hypothetical protein R3F56_06630 [Planctomycetota bacterium]
MHSGQRGRADAFSAAVAVFCTALGAVLFFTNMTPAARERAQLQAVEDAHAHMRAELGRRLTDLRSRTESLGWDPQTLLLAIDDAGLTPAELLGEAPPGMPPVAAWTLDAR